MEDKKRYSEVITRSRMIRFALIAPIAGLLGAMWGNVQFFAVSALLVPQSLIWIIYLIYSFVDAFNDPIIGYLTDRSKKYTLKYGKRYIWIKIGVFISPIFLILCFISISTDVLVLTFWLILLMCTFETFLTILEVSHNSLFPDLFREPQQRRKVSAYGGAIGGLTSIFGAIFIPVMLAVGGGATSSTAYLITAIVIVIIVYLLTIPYLKGVKETDEMREFRTQLDESGKSSSPLKEVLGRIIRDRNWIALIIANTCFVIAGACMLYGLNFFVYFYLELSIEFASIPGLAYSGVAIISVLIWIKIAKKIGVKKSYTLSLFLAVVGFILFFIVEDLIGLTLVIAFMGVSSAANLGVVFQLAQAEAIDNAAANSGKREEGTYMGVLRVFSAFSYALQTIIFAIVTAFSGFDASLDWNDGFHQSAAAKLGLKLQMSLIPFAIIIIGAILFILTYKISKEKALENVDRLIELKL
ncbi:MAG: MFS transporter [Candidatus Hermodarchaeota archaeon]